MTEDRAAFVDCHIAPKAGLSAGDQAIADDYTAAIAAITGAAAELQRLSAERDELAERLEEIELAEPVAWMHADGRMAGGWAPRSARAENFVGWSPLIYIPGVAPQPPASEPARELPEGLAMSGITQWAWAGSPDAEAGTLTMWPGAADELALPMPTFGAAHALAERLQAAIVRAERRGRAQALDEMARAIDAARPAPAARVRARRTP